MAEYGLYGAMVRHSLPLPETILKAAGSKKKKKSVSTDDCTIDKPEDELYHDSEEENLNNSECVAPWLLGNS